MEHLNGLIRHGAVVTSENKKVRIPLSNGFYADMLCVIMQTCKIKALTFSLEIPGVHADLGITLWNNGHVDSGSKPTILKAVRHSLILWT